MTTHCTTMPRGRRSIGAIALTLAAALTAACSDGDDALTAAQLGADAGTPVSLLDAAAAGRDSGADAGSGPLTPALPTADAAAPPGAFPPGVGVTTASDRTAACASADEGSFRNAPEDPDVVQACLPNVRAWAPVACGGPKPACTCDATRCAPKEVAKLVSGAFCICLSPCTTQAQGATCGAGGARKCVLVDDVNRKQVFVCGGAR